MKSGKPHRVPLMKSALAVLDEAADLHDGSALVFPSPSKPGNPLSDMVWLKPFQQTGLKDRTTVHGLRSTFRDWSAECTDVPREVCELALAHTVGNAVEQAYSRSDLLNKRIALMDAWDEYLQNG